MKAHRTKFLNISLRKKSVAIFFLLVTLPSLLIGYIILNRYDAVLRRQFIDGMEKNLGTIEMNLTEKTKAIEDISNYMIYQENFRSFMETPATPKNMELLYKDKTAIEGFISFQIMSKRYIKSITLRGVSGNDLQMGEPVKGEEKPWSDLAHASRGGIVWTDSYPLESGWTGSKRVVSMFRVINSFDKPSNPVGEVIVRLDESEISALLTAALPQNQGSIFIIRTDGRVLQHPDDKLIGKPYPDNALLAEILSRPKNKVFTLKEEGDSYVVFNQPMESSDWMIVAMVKDSTIVEKTNAIKASLQILIFVILILGLLALIGFEFAIIRPILKLRRETHRVKLGDFSAQVEVRSRDEVGELSRQFNGMVSTIRELIDKKYKLEIRQKESELKILQSQMDPHFLYNTLDTIRWTARLEQAPETSQLIETLSRFIRMGMNGGGNHYTTLAGEYEFVRSYLNLQRKRMGGKLSFSLLMEATLQDASVLKKVIQPLVENSIKHGFKRQGGAIAVRGYQDGNDLIVEVADSGTGFAKDKLLVLRQALHDRARDERIRDEQVRDERVLGHAIWNIHERIQLVYGSGYGVELPDEQADTGACVRLRIPLWMNAKEAEA